EIGVAEDIDLNGFTFPAHLSGRSRYALLNGFRLCEMSALCDLQKPVELVVEIERAIRASSTGKDVAATNAPYCKSPTWASAGIEREVRPSVRKQVARIAEHLVREGRLTDREPMKPVRVMFPEMPDEPYNIGQHRSLSCLYPP